MNSIVSRLSEIEAAASSIVTEAEHQKSILEKQMQATRDEFDTNLDAETEKKINRIHANLQTQMDAILKKQEANNQNALSSLEKDFDKNRMRYAQEILTRITEV